MCTSRFWHMISYDHPRPDIPLRIPLVSRRFYIYTFSDPCPSSITIVPWGCRVVHQGVHLGAIPRLSPVPYLRWWAAWFSSQRTRHARWGPTSLPPPPSPSASEWGILTRTHWGRGRGKLACTCMAFIIIIIIIVLYSDWKYMVTWYMLNDIR